VVGTDTWTSLASNLTTTTYTDDTVEIGVDYTYRVVASNEAGTTASEPEDVLSNVETLAGNIEDGEVRNLSADKIYLLEGVVRVEDGGELHIPAGTLILGSTEVTPSALLVAQGGKLFSRGTAADPVVFTSAAPVGERRRGDWGGVALQGYSNCNFDEDPCISEGVGLPFGGDDVADNSGVIEYTRIEYCGYEVTFGNELNCLTMNGVGSGTELHHIQAHYGSDDGFEWFGGSVDLQYALATGISDDSFDYSTGWTGRGQFWIAQQDPADADWLYEVDGRETGFAAFPEPFTIPTIYNVTLVGGGVPCGADLSQNGMVHRRGTGGKLYNHIVTGTCGVALDVDNAETIARMNAGDFFIRNSIISGNGTNFDADNDGIDEAGLWGTAGWNNQLVNPMLADPFDRTDPDFRLQAGSPAIGTGAVPPNDGFFDTTANCVGAVCGQTEWYAGWTTVAQN
jgi:hypothetical protein